MRGAGLAEQVAAPPRVRTSACDAFVKIGGSILDDEPVAANLVKHLTALADTQRILVLTGGGKAAKRIKANQRASHADFYTCWKGGVRSLDVNAVLLSSYSPRFRIVCGLAELAECFVAGQIGILEPSSVILSSLHLTPDWEVTTDSMGLYFAALVGAPRYIIVSDVEGIYERLPAQDASLRPIERLGVEELERLPSSKLDSAFPDYFRAYSRPTFVVSGKYPTRVSAAIRGAPTVGTEIVCDPEAEGP